MARNKYISASDINKFIHCPYQWYYEKQYGQKAINDMFRELHPGSANISKMEQGRRFHRNYLTIWRLKVALCCVAIVIIFVAALYFLGVISWGG